MFFNNSPFCNVLTPSRVNVDLHKLKTPCLWLYLNDAGELSSIRARVNTAGFLVVGRLQSTRIVVIRDGVLTLSDHGCTEAVRCDDERLSVLLPSDEEGSSE